MPEQRERISAAVKQRAKELRQELTSAEKILWEVLRDRKLGGYKFRRQHPLGPFIADFYCAQRRLIVEVDGGIHLQQLEQDLARTQWLEQFGYRLIRFRNLDVEQDLENVCSTILKTCQG